MKAPFPVGAQRLSLADISAIGRQGAKVALSRQPTVRRRIVQSRAQLTAALERGEVIYAVNTGVGTHAVFLLTPDQIEKVQENTLRQLCCGTGPPLAEEIVRASMLLRAVTLARGYSAVRVEVIEQLVRFLNAGITPIVPRYGSVGASGDLIPSAYIGLALAGEGQVGWRGKTVAARRALEQSRIAPIRLSYKDGIALINGTTTMTAVASFVVADADPVVRAFLAAAALCVEALGASPEPFDQWVQQVKGHRGQIVVGRYLRRLLQGSSGVRSTAELRRRASDERAAGRSSEVIQSGYSVRCIPQGIGPMFESLESARAVVEMEANSANDNPLIDPTTGRIYHTGNFYGGHIARAMDGLKVDLANLANWAHALMAVMVDERFSSGLPPALVAAPGLNAGFKGMQLSLAALTCAVRQLASPSTTHPVSTEQHNQDIVSLGLHAALTARDAVECTRNATAILLLSACQAVDLKGTAARLGKGSGAVYRAIRARSELVEADRALQGDIAVVSRAIVSEELPLPPW
jgi:phenylalanine ammonia-lyase